jgi:hypothetical protein
VFKSFFWPSSAAQVGNRVLDWGRTLGASAVLTAASGASSVTARMAAVGALLAVTVAAAAATLVGVHIVAVAAAAAAPVAAVAVLTATVAAVSIVAAVAVPAVAEAAMAARIVAAAAAVAVAVAATNSSWERSRQCRQGGDGDYDSATASTESSEVYLHRSRRWQS